MFVYRVIGPPTTGTLITNATYFEKIEVSKGDNCVADVAAATIEIDNVAFWVRRHVRISFMIFDRRRHLRNSLSNQSSKCSRIAYSTPGRCNQILKLCSDPRNNIQPNFPIKILTKGTDIVWNSNPKQTLFLSYENSILNSISSRKNAAKINQWRTGFENHINAIGTVKSQ